jgi:hypothetical protein
MSGGCRDNVVLPSLVFFPCDAHYRFIFLYSLLLVSVEPVLGVLPLTFRQ